MASPFRSSDRSSSSPRSTPSRHLPNGNQRPNGYHRANRVSVDDSPSRQLLEEFGRMLINDDRAFKRSLDEQTAAQHKLHIEALDRALAKHEEVRTSAERARERHDLEIERERRRREEEEKRAVEKARRDLEEQKLAEQRRQMEEAEAREEVRRKQEALDREQEEARQNAEARKQREADDSRRRDEARRSQEAEELKKSTQEAERVEAVRRDSEANAKRLSSLQQEQQNAAQQSTTPSLQANGITPSSRPALSSTQAQTAPTQVSTSQATVPGLVSTPGERQAVHNRYLDLHRRLKQMREQVSTEVKKNPKLKDQLSDWRRAIQKCCGQLGKGSEAAVKESNRRAMQEIVQHLDAAAGVAEPSIDVTQYLVQNEQPPGANTQGPAVLVFLLNHFAKNIVSQFISESAVDSKSADAIGVLAATIFARPQYLFNGQSLIDLLWAKYHKHCPVLFGIYGSEKTKEGRAKLGWQVEGGAFVRDQEHYDRMSGLGAGFAALTLRDFGKSKNTNPAPNRIFWESLARILNTPAGETQPTHFVVLKAMLDNYVPRIIMIFGGAGLAALRQALIIFPNEKGPQDERGRRIPAVTALQAMPMVLQRDLHLTL